MLFEFLVESRAFRNEEMVSHRSKKELSEIMFLMLLALQLLSKTRFNRDADNYAKQTLSFPLFDRIYLSTTDLANLISTLKNAREYLDQPNADIPVLELKRYLRDFQANNMSNTLRRNFFYNLQSRLRINDSLILAFRRDIADSTQLTWQEKKIIGGRLYTQLRRYDYKCDVLALLQKLMDAKEE